MVHFRFLNIPVHIHPTFWLFLCMFSFNESLHLWQMLSLAIIASISLLFHEYGHALAAQKFGCSPEITLEGFGGYASYNGMGISDTSRFIITLSGPLFTAVLIGLSYSILHAHLFSSFSAIYFFHVLMHVNTLWLIVNMAPLLPLDGGKIVEYVLIRSLGQARGEQYSLILGNLTALIGLVYFLTQGYYLFAYLFAFYGWKNFQASTAHHKVSTSNDFSKYHHALTAIQNNEVDTAQQILKKLIGSKNPYVQQQSLESLVQILEQKGDLKAARAILRKMDLNKQSQSKWLLCKLAYAEGNYALFPKYAGEIYEIRPTFETAALNAKAFAHLGDEHYSMGWLNTALQFEDVERTKVEELLNDPALHSMQSHPLFPNLTAHQDL